MAEKCANCGRADLMQPDVANYQCLACGALTSMATHQVVMGGPQPVNVSATGAPVVELGQVAAQTAPRPARVDPSFVDPNIVSAEAAPAVSSIPVPESTAGTITGIMESSVEPEQIDFSALTPEQIAAIEAIAHPGA